MAKEKEQQYVETGPTIAAYVDALAIFLNFKFVAQDIFFRSYDSVFIILETALVMPKNKRFSVLYI